LALLAVLLLALSLLLPLWIYVSFLLAMIYELHWE